MSVQSKWYDEAQTIIRYTFEDQWTWDDYNAALNHCRALLDTVNYPVDLIYDFNHAPTPPRNLVTRFWQVSMTRHQNISGLIVVDFIDMKYQKDQLELLLYFDSFLFFVVMSARTNSLSSSNISPESTIYLLTAESVQPILNVCGRK